MPSLRSFPTLAILLLLSCQGALEGSGDESETEDPCASSICEGDGLTGGAGSGSSGGNGNGVLGVGGGSVGGTGGAGAGGAFGVGGQYGSGGLFTGGSSSGGSSSGGSGSTDDIFDSCRFHFGTTRDAALQNAQIREQIDYFVPGWMGLSNTFDQGYVCDDLDGTLAGKVPVVVAYVAAFYAKRVQGLNDCNVGQPDLCTHGAAIIKQNLNTIIDIYESYAQGYENCLDPDQPIIFEMEPDWYQYTLSSQTSPMTASEAGSIMTQFVQAVRAILPQAVFSMDISPWVPPNNGSDHGASWFSHFDLSLFRFINTSGGGTSAGTAKIRAANNMTWSGVRSATGKSILADTGYGVNGASEGHDSAWDNVGNINARIADGVVGIAQYNPESNWGSTISNIRGQLSTPSDCP